MGSSELVRSTKTGPWLTIGGNELIRSTKTGPMLTMGSNELVIIKIPTSFKTEFQFKDS